MVKKVVVIKRGRPAPVIIRRGPRVVKVRSRPYLSPMSEMRILSSIPGWIQILILLIILGGIGVGIYFGVKNDKDDDELIIINERSNWYNNWNF
mgnify:CR=1 FL=1|tara:strand:- start:592 stop:873 length:282 start_codon:yes stop_codon:yes gene_type:complete